MTMLTNFRWERFAQRVAKGDGEGAAYTAAFGVKGETAEVNGSKLLTRPDIAQRVAELRQQAVGAPAVDGATTATIFHPRELMPAARQGPGRPTVRSPEIAAAICDAIANGQSLYRITERPDMPSYSAVMVWLREDQEFQQHYAQAREAQADFLAEEALEIADKGSGDVQRDRLRFDARVWYAGKLRPKKYGPIKAEGPALNVGVNVGMVFADERRMELIRKKRLANAS
jgi:hypothetical protein